MKNLVDLDTRHISSTLVSVLIDFGLTPADIDDMDFQQFKDFCAQLDEKQLNALNGVVTNERWKSYIFSVLDNAAFIKNKK